MTGAAVPARAEKRIALLIGNQHYNAKVGPLKNPLDDIALMGAALDKLGFMVTLVQDADYRTIDTAIKRHIVAVRREGPGAIGFLYYSGHGAADPDTKINYLIPVDVANAEDEDLWYYSLNLNTVVESLRAQAPDATHYVVFDACRNELNLTRKGVKALSDRGFVPMAYTPGVMVAYATAPGRTASDVGEGGGSYAKALAEEIVKPGVDSMLVFTRAARRVQQQIGQDPFLSASTMPEVYFAGNTNPSSGPAPVANNQTPSIEAERGWAAVKDTTSIAILEAFTGRFKNTFYGELARARIAELKKQQVATAPPPPPMPPPAAPPPADNSNLVRALQQELKRVGCLSGEADGVWGERSRSAFRNFVKQASVNVGSDEPTTAGLDAATAAKNRVCPLVCDEDENLVNGRCVEKPRPQRARKARAERDTSERTSRAPSRERSSEEQPKSSKKLCFGPDRGGPLVACN